MVTRLHSSHFEALRSFIGTLHSTWHPVRNQPPAHVQDIPVMGHSGKDITSTKVVMVGLKCSPLHRLQDKGCHPQVHRECLQDCLKTIQSIGQHLAALLLNLDLLPVHVGDPRVASQRNDSSRVRNSETDMSPGLRTCLQCPRFPTTIMMQMKKATIRRTWAVQKAICQSAWSKLNSPWSNLPKGWGRSSTVHSTSGTKYGWLGFWRSSIGPLSGGRSVWNRFEMDRCTGRRQLQIFWRHLRTASCWIISIMMNRFSGGGWRWFWRNVQAKFRRRGKKQGGATCTQRRIWESVQVHRREVISQSCQIQRSWLWFAGCWMARIWF